MKSTFSRHINGCPSASGRISLLTLPSQCCTFPLLAESHYSRISTKHVIEVYLFAPHHWLCFPLPAESHGPLAPSPCCCAFPLLAESHCSHQSAALIGSGVVLPSRSALPHHFHSLSHPTTLAAAAVLPFFVLLTHCLQTSLNLTVTALEGLSITHPVVLLCHALNYICVWRLVDPSYDWQNSAILCQGQVLKGGFIRGASP